MTRRTIYKLWQNINTQELGSLYDVKTKQVGLELDRY